MISIYSISALIAAYLLGSIPTAVWLGQAFYGVDVREYGSGNAGATNTFRVLGKKPGIIVMVIDIMKGFTATKLAYLIGLSVTGPKYSAQFVNYELALGVIAVVGHLFPIFAGFRGGKGVATLFGMVLAVNPWAALLCVSVFLTVLLITKYVSLSSICAGFAFPLGTVFVFQSSIKAEVLYSICVCVLILVTHQKNIGISQRKCKDAEQKFM
jgi:glycerol-3-phosphate acyltransferase PlsY